MPPPLNWVGATYLFYGDENLPNTIDLAIPSTSRVTILGANSDDQSGGHSKGIGDVNGDGLADLLIGVPDGNGPDNTRPDAGESYLIYGAENLPHTIHLATLDEVDAVIWGANMGDSSGASIDGVGDVNGDGLADWLMGIPYYGTDNINNGVSYLFYGAENLPPVIDLAMPNPAGVTFWGADALDSSGSMVSSAGDVNGDGWADFLIAASGGDGPLNNRLNSGDSYLILGRPDLPPNISLSNLTNLGVSIFNMGTALYTANLTAVGIGDINGDGLSDSLITDADGKKASIILGQTDMPFTPTPGPSPTSVPTLQLTNTPTPTPTRTPTTTPGTITPSPTRTPTPLVTSTSTPTRTPTPSTPYISLDVNCHNGPTIFIWAMGYNWPVTQAIDFYLDDILIQRLSSGHYGYFQLFVVSHNVPDGLHEIKAVSESHVALATFTKPCLSTITPTITASPTTTPIASSTPLPTSTSTATFTPSPTPTAPAPLGYKVALPVIQKSFLLVLSSILPTAIPNQPVNEVGETFFSTTWSVPKLLPTNGRFYLSSHPAALQPIVVDDQLVLKIGEQELFRHLFSTKIVRICAPNGYPGRAQSG